MDPQAFAMAPMDDEDLTPETITALQQAEIAADRGRWISHEDILREFSSE